PTGGGGHQFHWNLPAGLRGGTAQGRHTLSDGFVQFRITARQVAPAGCHRIIRAIGGSGRASLKVPGIRKVLTNQAGAAVFTLLYDQRAIGLILEPPLAQRGGQQRVKPTGNERQQNKQKYSGT